MTILTSVIGLPRIYAMCGVSGELFGQLDMEEAGV